MFNQDLHPNTYNKLRSIHKYYIDLYNAIYQLKAENEEELNSIYKMIKKELIESMKYLPQNIIKDILNIIPFNNRYTKSYLKLAKIIIDDCHVTKVKGILYSSNILFYKEYGINLNNSDDCKITDLENFDIHYYFEQNKLENQDIHTDNTIYRAIMNNDKERFIVFIESEEFDEDQKLVSCLYPQTNKGFSLLELCCYHGAVDCFKLLRTIFESEITKTCLKLSFLGGNAEIINECLKYQKPNEKCMKYAIISHNIDFVTFLMNEYNLEIDLEACIECHNLESLLVYFDQANDVKRCFVYSAKLNISSLSEYFLYNGADINKKDYNGKTALHYAARNNSKEMAKLLILHGADINEKDENRKTALHYEAENNCKETAELLILHGANIDEKDENGYTALHYAARNNSKETTELLILYGININEKDENGYTVLHLAAEFNSKETAELLISHCTNINEKDKYGKTTLHLAAENDSKDVVEILISHGININEKEK
ncbi:ankyrin repeat protein, putative [Trichomonas vaginalis G3]|uniref:Ankyrin repeat protein, putative n=1 Tax=Trichomonas vaginalis (strain ATCC PRA-98 / G3) TaxID=412133 RepID=A2EPQ6_TRIV3|nr:spectrin binding [Trichomonas vaginalis G3]EAY05399.1 ankyrin repeat protein, putative [Trichomonas vaginalis G3]KAI5524088.1 spectrin binding [Trichomonas vaginalis G3]|eukprot:XP_001317622.1 ankyrin repeat protein [Trichomonas vaginalis G3]